MTEHVLDDLDVAHRPLKRAQYEAFAFSLVGQDVLVRNESHADPSDHEYQVSIENGVPSACECPADTKDDRACKHRLAVAIRPRILEAVHRLQMAADGGVPTKQARSGVGTAPPYKAQPSDGDTIREPVRTGRRFIPDEGTVHGR